MYILSAGTVSPVVMSTGSSPWFYQHFGLSEYDILKPIIRPRYYKEVQPILDGLNSGTMSHEKARELLAKIY